MTRVKKTRKTGPLAAAKKTQPEWEKPSRAKAPAKAPQKNKGRKPGSRFNVSNDQRQSSGAAGGRATEDPRFGSKKPIQLIRPDQLAEATQPAFDRNAALAELNAIENDDRLQALLDRADEGDELSANEARYVEERTERFAQLAEQLGIEIDDSDDDFDDLEFDNEFEDDDDR
jgi:hypothetical protein